MNKLNKNQWIAVCAGIILIGYLLFAGPIMSLFNQSSLNPSENLNTELPQTGFVANDIIVGEGLSAEKGDTLTVHYVGTLTDGKVFDSSVDRNIPFSFTLGTGGVIRGWEEGMVGMKVGGRRVLMIAPDYGYGAQVWGPIPANSTLIFEVELLDVKKSSSR